MSKIQVIALSGGKDSTAMALRLTELEPEQPRRYLCTPTGDELPEMRAHWSRLEQMLGAPIERVTNNGMTLASLIESYGALPNHRQRWCTRQLKIIPAARYLTALRAEGHDPVICVGLRADEPEREGAMFDDAVERYPLREWGWDLYDVIGYLRKRGISIPRRTDCARCYDQKVVEWWILDKEHPEIFAKAMHQEADTGHTFRTPGQRKKWPASLVELKARFDAGHKPQGATRQLKMFPEYARKRCRVCTL